MVGKSKYIKWKWKNILSLLSSRFLSKFLKMEQSNWNVIYSDKSEGNM